MSNSDTIVLLGNGMTWSLEKSYERAFNQLGYNTVLFDVQSRLNSKLPFPKITKRLRVVLNDRKWLIDMNRELATEILDMNPKAVLVFCNAEILYGTLALLQTASKAKTILIWPDTPFNLTPEVRLAIPLYDLVCTYSLNSIPVFKNLGGRHVIWVPLASDPELHAYDSAPDTTNYDVSFIGNWRPEREAAFSAIVKSFKDRQIRISGTFWKEKTRDKSLLEYVDETALTGRDYARFINQSCINLNVIDRTNYPAANMRFFEIPMAFGFQLSSLCPEQEDIFLDDVHMKYYTDLKDLVDKVGYCLSNPSKVQDMKRNANEIVNGHHTYAKRVERIMHEL